MKRERKEIASIAMLLHVYRTDEGYEAELEKMEEGDTTITQEELEALIARSDCNARMPDKLPEIKTSMRIAQTLFILGKVRELAMELANNDPAELRKKLETGEVAISDTLQKSIHSASKWFNNTYASCQDKMCRQMGKKISDWEFLVYDWLVEGNNTDIKNLLMTNIPNSASRGNDVLVINEFFEKG